MTTTSPYQLFVSSKCSCCDDVLAYIKEEEINILVTNTDKEKCNLPFSIMIFPALVLGEKLISYGCEDIIYKLQKP